MGFTVSSFHSGVFFPLGASSAGFRSGPLLGMDVSTQGRAHWDPFECYGANGVTNTNTVVLGAPGNGKSAFVKTFLWRSAAITPERRTAIIDPKGEYVELGRALGLDVVSLRPQGDVRVNPIGGVDIGPEANQRRVTLLTALVGQVLGRPLTQLERECLWHVVVFVTSNGSATLNHVLDALRSPDVDVMAACDIESVAAWTSEVADLRRSVSQLVERDLAGMFDGEGTVSPSMSGRGVVVDLSAVQNDPSLLVLVMTAAIGWLAELRTAGVAGGQWVQVWDEAWHLFGHGPLAEFLQASFKLGRSWGVANILVAHRPTDFSAQAASGSSTAKIAAGLTSDAATLILFRMAQEEIAVSAAALGLTPHLAGVAGRLAKGRSLQRIGDSWRVVQGVYSPTSEWFVDTDRAVRGEA